MGAIPVTYQLVSGAESLATGWWVNLLLVPLVGYGFLRRRGLALRRSTLLTRAICGCAFGQPLTWLLVALACPIVMASAAEQAPPTSDQRIETARHGMQLLMDGEFDQAILVFRQIEQTDPESPLGYVLEADANWWKIYLTEGNLIDPDVFEALSEATTPYDPDFQRLNNLAIEKAEAHIHSHQDEARAYLYEGFAYALQSRLQALRDQALATARAGKKMRNLSLRALKLDPTLYDADLGVGIYNYFEATLPTYVKMLRFLILLPGGDRELGLQQLQTAADKGEITKGEAQFHLAKNLSRNSERQYAKSLEILRSMTREYPGNPLWKLLVGGLEIRIGQTQPGEALYREVVKETENPKSEVWKPLHQQAQKALDRRSGH